MTSSSHGPAKRILATISNDPVIICVVNDPIMTVHGVK